jgi:hypothetical protein
VKKAKICEHAEMIAFRDLCESSHQLVKCPHYDLVLEARLNNSRVVPGSDSGNAVSAGGISITRENVLAGWN